MSALPPDGPLTSPTRNPGELGILKIKHCQMSNCAELDINLFNVDGNQVEHKLVVCEPPVINRWEKDFQTLLISLLRPTDTAMLKFGKQFNFKTVSLQSKSNYAHNMTPLLTNIFHPELV